MRVWPSHCPECKSSHLRIRERIEGVGKKRKTFFDTVCETCHFVVNKDV